MSDTHEDKMDEVEPVEEVPGEKAVPNGVEIGLVGKDERKTKAKEDKKKKKKKQFHAITEHNIRSIINGKRVDHHACDLIVKMLTDFANKTIDEANNDRKNQKMKTIMPDHVIGSAKRLMPILTDQSMMASSLYSEVALWVNKAIDATTNTTTTTAD